MNFRFKRIQLKEIYLITRNKGVQNIAEEEKQSARNSKQEEHYHIIVQGGKKALNLSDLMKIWNNKTLTVVRRRGKETHQIREQSTVKL